MRLGFGMLSLGCPALAMTSMFCNDHHSFRSYPWVSLMNFVSYVVVCDELCLRMLIGVLFELFVSCNELFSTDRKSVV